MSHATRIAERPTWQQALIAGAIVALCLFLGFLSGQIGDSDSEWYRALDTPPFQPPGWLFGPVWSLLYALMGVSTFLILRLGLDTPGVVTALTLFVAQFLLNLVWSPVFFALESISGALVIILLLVIVLSVTIWKFFSLSRVAGWLLIPYLMWVTFATVLTFSIWTLN